MASGIQIRLLNLGSCNGCDVEILDLLHRDNRLALVGKGRGADVLLITGSLTRRNVARLSDIRMKISVPILFVGACAISGGLFAPSEGDIERIIQISGCPVFYVFGCPPLPEDIADAIEKSAKKEVGSGVRS